MASTYPPSPRIPWIDWALIVVFAGFISLPTVDFFTGIDITGPPSENRLPAPAPKFSSPNMAGLRGFLAAAEPYFNDHFGFRKRLVRWYQQWKIRLFNDPGVVTQRVLKGQDGWLFYAEDQMVDHYLGLDTFSAAQLDAWRKLLERRRDWLAAQGISYVFIIAPDKQTIYPEELPAWLVAAAPSRRQTKLDQFMQYMREHSTVDVLDLRPSLIAGRKVAPTYLKNDLHWNAFGAFLATQDLLKALAPQFPEMPPLRLDDFNWSNCPAAGGDLARMLGAQPAEPNYFAFAPKPPMKPAQFQTLTNIVRIWNQQDKAKVNVLVENTNITWPPVDLVMFHDSFGGAMRPFLGYRFRRCVCVWENQEFNPRVITHNHPQVVVSEVLERFMNLEDPNEMMAKEGLP